MLIMGKPIKQLCPPYRFFAPYYITSFIAFGSCCMLGIFDIVCSWMKQKIISVSWKLNFKFRGFHALFTIMPVWRDRQQTVSHFMLSFFPFVFWRHLIATMNMWMTCERSEEVKIKKTIPKGGLQSYSIVKVSKHFLKTGFYICRRWSVASNILLTEWC